MQKIVFSFLIVIATTVAFKDVSRLDFVWTDRDTLSSLAADAGPALKGMPDFWKSPRASSYAPVSTTTLALTTAFAQPHTAVTEAAALPSARVYHLLGLSLHIANTVLVFLLLSYCLPQIWPAFIGALLFAMHPLQTEAVAWISAFPFMLGSFLSLIALWQYLAYSRKQDTYTRSARMRHRPIRHFYAASVAFILALLCSPVALVTPLLGLVLDRLRPSERSLRTTRRPLWPMALWLIPAIPFAIWTAALQNTTALSSSAPFWLRPFVAGDAVAFYLYKIIWPLQIGPDFGRSPLLIKTHWWGYFTWLIPIALGFFLALGRGKTRTLLSGALTLLIFALLPFLGFLAFEAQATSTIASRFAYLAMIGPALALGALAGMPKKPVLAGLAVILVAVLGYLTRAQVQTWQNDDTLWNQALAVNPNSPIAHQILADRYRLDQNWDEARIHYQKVLAVNATDPETHFYLAEIERRRGDLPQALELYRKVLELDPTYSPAYNSYGLALLSSGKTDEALERFTKAVELNPKSIEPLLNLGRLYVQMKKYPEAVVVLNQTLSLSDQSAGSKRLAEIHALLGLSLANTSQSEEAQTHLEQALTLDSHNPTSHRTLADIYFVQKRYPEALKHYQEAVLQITDDPEVYNNIGVILALNKKNDQAVTQFNKALALAPKMTSAQQNIGTAYFNLRNFKEAISHFKAALALDPNLADPHYYMGDIARWQGRESEALGEYFTALKIDPNHLEAHYRLGNHYMKESEMDQAIRHFQAALKVAPEDPRVIGQLRRAERAKEGQSM